MVCFSLLIAGLALQASALQPMELEKEGVLMLSEVAPDKNSSVDIAAENSAESASAKQSNKPGYYIYVATLPKRLEYAQTALKAIDASANSLLEPATTPAGVNKSQIASYSEMNIKETACFVSHYKNYQKFLKSDNEYAIVMEDDFMNTAFLDGLLKQNGKSYFHTLIQSFIDSRDKAPWDLLNLGRCYDCCMPRCQKVHKAFDNGAKIASTPHPYCGTAYLINKKAARVLSDENMPVYKETDDNMLLHGVKGEINYMSVTPRLFMQKRTTFGSTLHDEPDDIECKPCSQNMCAHKDDTDMYTKPGYAIKNEVSTLEGFMHSTEPQEFYIGAITMPKSRPHVRAFFDNLLLTSEGAQIVPGVVRSKLNVSQLVAKGEVDPSYVKTEGTAKHNMVAELATTFAHGRAVKQFIESKAKYGIIFEDDVTLIDGVIESIPEGKKGGFMGAVRTMIDKAPKGWDELNLGRCAAECQRQSLAARLSGNSFLVSSRYQYCSLAYVLSQEGAKKVDKMVHDKVKYSNDQLKVLAYEFGDYNQYSLQPRMFATTGRCGVNSCGLVKECVNAKTSDSFNCGKKVFNATTGKESVLKC